MGGDKVFNILLEDKLANKFEEQDLMIFNLTFSSMAQMENVGEENHFHSCF